jgi:hypothetical protein
MTMPTGPSRPSKPALGFDDDDDETPPQGRSNAARPKQHSTFPVKSPPTMTSVSEQKPTEDEEDDEDDYMSMAIPDPLQSETPLQRLKRQKAEAAARGRPLSKAELAEQERQKREIGLSTSLMENKASKGLKMMKAMGFQPGGALGKQYGQVAPATNDAAPEDTAKELPASQRRLEPIRPNPREKRSGIGHESDLKRKFLDVSQDATSSDENPAKKQDASPEDYRIRMRDERLTKRYAGQLHGAQVIVERLAAEMRPEGWIIVEDKEPTSSVERVESQGPAGY